MTLVLPNLEIEELLRGNEVNLRANVRVATTANGTLATAFAAGQMVDGVTLVTDDRILLKDQSTGSENGIYVVTAGAPVRAEDLIAGDSANSVFLWVQEGSANANSEWVCTSASGSDVVGADALVFTQADVVSTLTVARGGTGATSFTTNGVLYGDGTNPVQVTAPVNNGVLVTDGSGVPSVSTTLPSGLEMPSSILTSPEINDAGLDHQYVVTVNDLAANRNIELPLLTGDDVFVFEEHAQTLQNKSLVDASTFIVDDVDDTKRVQFQVSGVATGTTRTLTIPDANGTIATQEYVAGVIEGLDVKQSVRVATTAAGTLATSFANGQMVDGVTLVTGDRILIKDQAMGEENGIYVVQAAGAPVRSDDANADADVTAGLFTFVEEGTDNGDNGYVLTTNDPIVVGTTPLVFSQFSGAGQIIAGDGLDKSGNTLSVDLKANGGLVIEATEIAVDLSASNITGTLAVADGGTGNTTLTANGVMIGDGTNPVDTSKQAPTGDFVGTSDTQILENKTLTLPEINDTSADHQYVFTVNELTADRNIELPLLINNDVFVFEDHIQSLENKTLVNPIIDSNLLDVNQNELISFTATAMAVNEFSMANAATGNNPTFSASGDDANIGIDFQGKGTGNYNFLGESTKPAELRIYEDTDNGTDYVGIDVPADVTTSYTLTLPAAVGSAGQSIRLADGSGNLEFYTAPTSRISYVLQSNQIVANSGSSTSVAYFAWDNSEYSGYMNGTIIFYYEAPAATLNIDVFDGTMAIGSSSGLSGTGIGTFTITHPVADARLELRVSKSGGGTNPRIYGVQLEFTN